MARFERLLVVAVCAGGVLAGCGQRGPLYLPDRNARVVTRPGVAAGSAPASSAPGQSPLPRADSAPR